MPHNHWNWGNWEIRLKTCSRPAQTRTVQRCFLFFLFPSKPYKCWGKDRKAASKMWTGLGSSALWRTRSRDVGKAGAGSCWDRCLMPALPPPHGCILLTPSTRATSTNAPGVSTEAECFSCGFITHVAPRSVSPLPTATKRAPEAGGTTPHPDQHNPPLIKEEWD